MERVRAPKSCPRRRNGRKFSGVNVLSRRLVWHSLGLIVAVAVAWLIFRGYRQPEFLLDLANMRLC